jgi:hypothetical protein
MAKATCDYSVQTERVLHSSNDGTLIEQEHFRQQPESHDFGWNITEPNSANLDDVNLVLGLEDLNWLRVAYYLGGSGGSRRKRIKIDNCRGRLRQLKNNGISFVIFISIFYHNRPYHYA